MSEQTETSVLRQREKAAAYYRKNRDRISIRNRARYQQKKALLDAAHMAYYRKHQKDLTAKNIEWQKRHPEAVAAAKHRWYLKNRERESVRHAKYAKENPEIYVLAAHKRRALKRKAAVNLSHIREWMVSVRSKPFSICYYCQKKISETEIHFDHIEPLSKGGAHSVENLCVSCGPCNQSKHDKGVRAWVRIGQQVLEL